MGTLFSPSQKYYPFYPSSLYHDLVVGPKYCMLGFLSNDPEYQMVELDFHGNPVVELLHKGGPIHEFNEQFRFGVRQAVLSLAGMSVVEILT
jgi:hypothetical protein